MATIVNTPVPAPEERGYSSAGWAVSVIILIVIIAGIAFWYMRYHQAPAAQNPGTTIQVNLPTGGDTSNGQGGGSAPAPAQ